MDTGTAIPAMAIPGTVTQVTVATTATAAATSSTR